MTDGPPPLPAIDHHFTEEEHRHIADAARKRAETAKRAAVLPKDERDPTDVFRERVAKGARR